MRSMAVGSVVAVMLFTGLFVSQVEAKTGGEHHGTNPPVVIHPVKHNDNNKSVPIPGTELLLGGGFAGLIAWRARQRKPRA